MGEKLPWDDPLWTECLEIQSIKPRLNGTISLMAISKTSENMTEEEIAGIRKLNSDKFHSNKVHGFPGVYYYFKMDNLGTPEIYAGKAGHLGRRAGRPDRLAEQDMVMAIRLNGIMNDEDIHMDDNWRQHLEHLMINDLKDRVDKFGIRIENLIYAKKDRKKFFFKNLTLAPIDTDLINYKMLNTSEKKYLFNYHMDTYAKISKFLNSNEKKWFLNLV